MFTSITVLLFILKYNAHCYHLIIAIYYIFFGRILIHIIFALFLIFKSTGATYNVDRRVKKVVILYDC